MKKTTIKTTTYCDICGWSFKPYRPTGFGEHEYHVWGLNIQLPHVAIECKDICPKCAKEIGNLYMKLREGSQEEEKGQEEQGKDPGERVINDMEEC